MAPPAQGTHGEITVPQRGSVAPAGGTARPVTSASGEIDVPQHGSVTPAGGTPRPVTSMGGEIGTVPRNLGLPTVRSAVGGELQGQLVGLVADYFKYKLNQYFDRKKFEQRMRELQPQIEDMKQLVYDASPKETRALIDQRQMYWVIRLRVSVKTTIVIAGRASTTLNSGPIPELVSVRISAAPAGEQGPVEEKTPVVAPALHAVILLENMQNITYSEPIISWHNAEIERIGKAAAEFSRRATPPRPTEQIDALRFSATGKVVTTESLLAWARRTHPRGLADQGLLKDLYGSHEFSGSQDAHDRAAMALFFRLREEEGTAPVAK